MTTLSACADYSWRQETWAKTNFAEAHNDCTIKAKIALGNQQGNYDFSYTTRRNSFIQECMQGQGYTLVKN